MDLEAVALSLAMPALRLRLCRRQQLIVHLVGGAVSSGLPYKSLLLSSRMHAHTPGTPTQKEGCSLSLSLSLSLCMVDSPCQISLVSLIPLCGFHRHSYAPLCLPLPCSSPLWPTVHKLKPAWSLPVSGQAQGGRQTRACHDRSRSLVCGQPAQPTRSQSSGTLTHYSVD
jgi:hypothetical protein